MAAKIKMGRLYDGRRDRPVAWWQKNICFILIGRFIRPGNMRDEKGAKEKPQVPFQPFFNCPVLARIRCVSTSEPVRTEMTLATLLLTNQKGNRQLKNYCFFLWWRFQSFLRFLPQRRVIDFTSLLDQRVSFENVAGIRIFPDGPSATRKQCRRCALCRTGA
jgi:hypothetical protein